MEQNEIERFEREMKSDYPWNSSKKLYALDWPALVVMVGLKTQAC